MMYFTHQVLIFLVTILALKYLCSETLREAQTIFENELNSKPQE